MKTFYNFIFCLFMVCTATLLKGQTYNPDDYQLIGVYSDEFTSTTMNSGIWYNPFWSGDNPYKEGVLFQSLRTTFGNVSPSDPSSNRYMRITPAYDAGTNSYYSGAITSNHLFRYGYYETRVKMPGRTDNSLNATSSWWFWNGLNGTYNEIDVFETPLSYNIQGGAHLGTCGMYDYEVDYRVRPPSDKTTGYTLLPMTLDEQKMNGSDLTTRLGINLSSSFHTFGLEWTPDHISTYIDGVLYKTIDAFWANTSDPNCKIYGDKTGADKINVPQRTVFWLKRGGWMHDANGNIIAQNTQPNQDGNTSDYLEVDYFRFYKLKPFLRTADYTSGSNQLILTANTGDEADIYTWSIVSGNISISSQANGSATFTIPAGFTSSTVNVSATGRYPSTDPEPSPGTHPSVNASSRSFYIEKNSGSICSLSFSTSIPYLYYAYSFTAPMLGCSSTVLYPGTDVSFIAENDITLNPGFEVQLGASFGAFIQ